MRFFRNLSILICASMAGVAAAADSFSFAELRASDTVKDVLVPEVKVYWADQTAPEFAELARPDIYTRSSISLSPFGGGKRHCVDAFQRTLRAMIEDARDRGYDAIIDVRAAREGKPSADPSGFTCNPGYKTTEVPLIGTFAMSAAARDKALAQLDAVAKAAPRAPVPGAIFVPLQPILESPEARALLGGTLTLHAGLAAPALRERYGPEVFEAQADPREAGPEQACKAATLAALKDITQSAREKGYDSILQVMSFHEGRYTPGARDLECQVGKRSVQVSLKATLANAR